MDRLLMDRLLMDIYTCTPFSESIVLLVSTSINVCQMGINSVQ